MAALAQWTSVNMIDNGVNEMEVHIQQTNDRLQCIRQVTNRLNCLAHCCHAGTAVKHPVLDRVKLSFAIFDVRAL